jgi:hypothetical protein
MTTRGRGALRGGLLTRCIVVSPRGTRKPAVAVQILPPGAAAAARAASAAPAARRHAV